MRVDLFPPPQSSVIQFLPQQYPRSPWSDTYSNPWIGCNRGSHVRNVVSALCSKSQTVVVKPGREPSFCELSDTTYCIPATRSRANGVIQDYLSELRCSQLLQKLIHEKQRMEMLGVVTPVRSWSNSLAIHQGGRGGGGRRGGAFE